MALYVLPNGRKAVNVMENNSFELRYNVTGSERKRLVTAMGKILEVKPKYLGAPSFAYKVDYFTVDKNGTVTFDARVDSEEIEKLMYTLSDKGFEAETPECADSLVISYPRENISEAALENLRLLVSSKETLIKKALGADDLPIEVSEDKVSFPWFTGGPTPEEVSAYAHFTGKLLGMAKTQKRVTAKEKDSDNDKYAFRCFLLRLGFIGDEYKEARKILLRNLVGSSAFKVHGDKGFSQDDLEKVKANPDTRAEIKAILVEEDGGSDE